MTVRVVIVSAAEDGTSLDQLRRHLAPHLQSRLIELWSEGDIRGGQDRERELRDRLDAAQIIIILVSSALIAMESGVVADIDGALARRKLGEVDVVPVLVRCCDWKATPLARLQALPRDERPVGTWQHPDQAWTEIVREVRAIAERFAVSGAAAAPPHGSRAPSTPPPSVRFTGVFVGREAELRALDETLLPASGGARPMAVCALHGMPGVGKSYLADHFAALRAERFPGGVVRLVLRSDEERPAREIEAHLLGQLADQLHVPFGGADVAERISERLLLPRRLVHIENVDAFASAQAAISLVSKLRGGAIIITGRYRDLAARGWVRVELAPFDEATSLMQLEAEIHPARDHAEQARFRRLAAELGHLPLALHLASAYLREADFTIDTFLAHLRGRALDVDPEDPSRWAFCHEPERANLRCAFGLSLELLRRHLGPDADALMVGFSALGHAQVGGFGRSLGAAIAGISAVDFDRLVRAARKLSLLLLRSEDPSDEPRWYIHPLLAEMMRGHPGSEAALDRMERWFLERLPELPPEHEAVQGERWKEVQQEIPALVAWLDRMTGDEVMRVARLAGWYAIRNGPFAAWLELRERGLTSAIDPEDRSHLLWVFMHVAYNSGAMDDALELAMEKETFDRRRGAARSAAIAAGLRADILQALGQLDEALRIRWEEELPVYEMLGDVHSRAVTMGQVADILRARGQADEALRILQQEQLPAYDRLGDQRSRAVTMGQIADILQVRGQLDEALRIRENEQVPVYERLGDMRERAVTMGQIADLLQARGQVDEALRIRQQEQLPVLEQLGAVRDLVVGRANCALNLLARDVPGDRDAAAQLLQSAYEAAQALRIPEADLIRQYQEIFIRQPDSGHPP